jgi:hypothetical protein
MNQATITASVRRGIREPGVRTVTNADIEAMTLRGVTALGLEIKECEPSFFRKRAILQSNHYEFDFPSNCLTVEQVWDTRTNADAVEGASTATPIVIDATAHTFEDDSPVFIYGVGGITEANGLWNVANEATDDFELEGSVGVGTYTSGGLILAMKSEFRLMTPINPKHANLQNRLSYSISNEKIVIDYKDFSNDLLIYFMGSPDAIADIPAEYHEGLVSFCVLQLLRIPAQNAKDYGDKTNSYNFHRGIYDLVVRQIARTLKGSTGPKELYDVMRWDVT